MTSKLFVHCALSVLLLLFPACTLEKIEPKPDRNVLARVNGAVITEDDRYLLLQGGHAGMDTSENRTQALEDLIERELLYQRGLKLGLDKDLKYQNAVKVMEMRVREFKRAEMARRVASTQIAASVNVTNEDVTWYIDRNRERLKNEFHLWALRFGDEAEARQALTRIQNGSTFESIANGKYPSSLNITMKRPSWDLGYVRWYHIPAAWREAVEQLRNGEVSTLLQEKRIGFSIIKLIDRRSETKTDFESMRAGIMNSLRDEMLDKAYNEYITGLKRSAKIIQYEERGKSLEK